MEDLVFLLSIFGAGMFVGWMWHAKIMFRKIVENPDKMIQMIQSVKSIRLEIDTDNDEPVELIVEKEQDQYYLYSKHDNQFLIQSSTLESALEKLKEQFPDKSFKGLVSAEKAKEWGLSKQD
jgi:hypothetical protein